MHCWGREMRWFEHFVFHFITTWTLEQNPKISILLTKQKRNEKPSKFLHHNLPFNETPPPDGRVKSQPHSCKIHVCTRQPASSSCAARVQVAVHAWVAVMPSHLHAYLTWAFVVPMLCNGANLGLQTARPREVRIHPESLLKIMFADATDAARYQSQCGRRWHKNLFQDWERHQHLALRNGIDKAVVWSCRQHCGGLGDRWRGLLTSFMLALILRRAFFIDNEMPVPLRNYFHLANPTLHWNFDEAYIDGKTVLRERIIDASSIGDYSKANLSLYDDYEVIIQASTFYQPFHILRNAATLGTVYQSFEEHTLAGCLLNYLLVPSRHLQLQVLNMKRTVTEQRKMLVALQIRTGDGQAKNSTILTELVQRFQECISNITSTSSGFRLFLTTDSQRVVQLLQKVHPDLLLFSGQIFHIDGDFGSPTDMDSAFRKVILDHMLLSRASKVIISRSGFAELAMLRGFQEYFTPINCHSDDPIMHYTFPSHNPRPVPVEAASTQELLTLWDNL